MGVKKILTIKLEIEVNEKVTRHSRVSDTYGEVVIAAMEAARAHMPTDSIEQITTQARWEYRHWDPKPITYANGEVPEVEDLTDDEIEWLDEE
ncbi:hypothetical protein [Streptomyces olivochromogenes]|uniref:Uncharacterized protein n=1 Tax=Streptomyces olivochromogenes TaxID=1963 RepID=A0A250VNQ8_STROL|nr:hypothetical protein [Streptomyces olivochromogenes]KUN43417.1 hypothetical protein AQJ27_30550 [Streptomyces olivochromogenes]GAX55781.1 hypothetical protein SO3561_07343 [Streptomyces olivochromogenes]